MSELLPLFVELCPGKVAYSPEGHLGSIKRADGVGYYTQTAPLPLQISLPPPLYTCRVYHVRSHSLKLNDLADEGTELGKESKKMKEKGEKCENFKDHEIIIVH